MSKYNNFSENIQKDLYNDALKQAYDISLKDYSKDEIMRILSENDDIIKPVAIINLKSIENEFEAKLLLKHLTGKDGRIREAASYMLFELEGVSSFYTDKSSLLTILDGISDINPNVCRNIISFIDKNKDLKEKITPYVINKTKEVIEGLSKFLKEGSKFIENQSKSTKNHAKNKLTFNLFWLLSCISVLDINKIENLDTILTKTANFIDYTIREKTAIILSKMDNPPDKLLQKLKNDENIYVKNPLFVINSSGVV